MFMQPLAIAVTGLAVATQAFLVPPEVSESDLRAANAFPVALPKSANSKDVNLTCTACPVQLSDLGAFEIVAEMANHLELKFNIDNSKSVWEDDRLLLNGYQLYPDGDPLQAPLMAMQVPESDKQAYHGRPHEHKQKLGFGLETKGPIKTTDGAELVTLEFQVLEVGNSFVNGVPNVEIKLIKSGRKLMIGSLETTPSKTTPSNPMDKQSKCTTMFCRLRALAAEQLAHLKSFRPFKHCGMKHHGGHHHRLPSHNRFNPNSHHNKNKGAHHDAEKHRADHFNMKQHTWGQLFGYIATHILLPILVGIVAGVSVSIIGMLIGTFIVCLWRLFFRRRSHGHRRRHSSHAHKFPKQDEEEKAGLIDDQTAQDPPPYKDDESTVDESERDVGESSIRIV